MVKSDVDGGLEATMEVDFAGMVSEAMQGGTTTRAAASLETTQISADSELAVGASGPAAEPAPRPSRQTGVPGPSGRRRRGGMIIPRPSLLTRIVMMGTLTLLAGLAVMAALTANAVGSLVDAVRADHRAQHSRLLDEPLPPDAELRDAEVFATHLAARPDRTAALHARRGVLLTEHGAGAEALTHFRTARLHSAIGLNREQRLAEAQAFIATGDLAIAQSRLELLQAEALDADQKRQVLGLLGRLYMRDGIAVGATDRW